MDKELESTFELINENKCLEIISDNEFDISQSAKLEFEEQLNTKLYNGCQKTFDE